MNAVICTRRNCGQSMHEKLDAIGRVIFVCDACERNKRGLCRDCPRALKSPRSMRCAICAEASRREYVRLRSAARYADPEFRAKKLARMKERSRLPEVRAARTEYKKAWPERNPGYMRFAQRKYKLNPKSRAKLNRKRREWTKRPEVRARLAEQRRKYYAAHREELCAKERERQRAKQNRRRERAA